jgi:3-phenylpropionate/cinnamic acid dioxygenase small subunit
MTNERPEYSEQTDFQRRLKPQRLPMMAAEYSGEVIPADLNYIADRLTIINHVTAYSYLIDEGRWEEWFSLFSDDVLFETTIPCFGTIRVKGKPGFRTFVDIRFRGPGSETNDNAHRHLMGNVHVAYQDETRAEVRTYILISDAPNCKPFSMLTSGTYMATLEKREGRWTITRWYIETDAVVPKSAIPDLGDEIEFIPDDRECCQ